jgi:hypothetical protein
MDTIGRNVCPYSFGTKSRGCNSADDRVEIENQQRPQYMQYITLDASGIQGQIYGNQIDMQNRTKELKAVNKITGQFGEQFGASVLPGCMNKTYDNGLNQEARADQIAAQKAKNLAEKAAAGF